MPYVTGETLRQRLEREEQLPINAAITIAKEVADALSAAHEMGIVHRDIKPENILLRGNHALVADFGIALAVQQAGGARMTQTGLSLGTPQYMSPEQAMGERNIGPKSDIYSLRRSHIRDARRRAAIHRSQRAGDRREGDDRAAGPTLDDSQHRSTRRRERGTYCTRKTSRRSILDGE